MTEIVTVRTEDGLALDAAYWPAAGDAPARADACVLLHGAGGSAFGPTQRALAEGLAQQGVATLTLNTRGHDTVSRFVRAGQSVLGGVAFEDLDEAPFDVAAGVAWLQARGHQRVATAGHSLGAVKVILTASVAPVAGVTALIALSPPCFSYAMYAGSPLGATFTATLDRARALVEAGRGQELISAEAPIVQLFAAAQYAKKYGPEDRYDLAAHLSRATVPALLLYGTREAAEMINIGGTASLADSLRAASPNLSVAVIPNADHVYTTTLPAVLAAVGDWLRAPVAVGG